MATGGPARIRTASLALLGIAGPAVFIACLTALQFLQKPLGEADSLSEYALGRYGWLMNVAFIAPGVGFLALAIALRRALGTTIAARIGWVLLAVAGGGWILLGVANTDPEGAPRTTLHIVHGIGFTLGFPALILAPIFLALAFRKNDRWRAISFWSAGLGVAAVLAFGLTEVTQGISFPVAVALLMLWAALTGMRLRSGPPGV